MGPGEKSLPGVDAATDTRVGSAASPSTGTARMACNWVRNPAVDTFDRLWLTTACWSMLCLAPLMAV
ncbi:hypothetical protein Q427_16755 [Halomonas sp. BC04]|nr:hypothetical protein Q427_16755 [Halomonas sp. BC04]